MFSANRIEPSRTAPVARTSTPWPEPVGVDAISPPSSVARSRIHFCLVPVLRGSPFGERSQPRKRQGRGEQKTLARARRHARTSWRRWWPGEAFSSRFSAREALPRPHRGRISRRKNEGRRWWLRYASSRVSSYLGALTLPSLSTIQYTYFSLCLSVPS